MNAHLTPEQRAQRTDEPRIERLRRTLVVDLPSMKAIVSDLNLPVNTGGHYSRANVDILNDILRAHSERVAAIKIERVLRGFVARLRAAWRRAARLPSRLESLPAVLTMGLIGISDARGALALECTSLSMMRTLRAETRENDYAWRQMLMSRWPAEGPLLPELLELQPGATLRQLYHMFATKRMLPTNIDDHYGESSAIKIERVLRGFVARLRAAWGESLAKLFYEGPRQLQDVLPEYVNHQVVPEPLDNSPNRLVFVLSLRCGSFLLRWDGTQAVCEAVLEKHVHVYSQLATLHVIDMKTFKCATICEDLEAGGDLDNNPRTVYFMVPDFMRHNLPREFEDSSDLHDYELVEGDATAEVCRMQLWLTLRRARNNKFILKAQFLENNCSLDFLGYVETVTTVDQDDSDDALAVRQLLVDAIEQS